MMRKFIFMLSAVVAVQTANALASSPPENVEAPLPPHASFVADRSPAAARGIARDDSSEDDEFNFSWLDPDKKVYVLQNRKYRKKNRFAVFLSGGLNLSNPYRTEYVGTPRFAYWFSEQFGLEAFYTAVTNSDNSTLTALKHASPTALPFVRETRSYYGALLTWTPWYAKLNFFNKILYFDWFFFAGAGQVNTAFDQNTRADRAANYLTESMFAAYFGTGQNFFVTKNFLVRLDLMGMMYNAKTADNQGTANTTNFDFTAGIGWAF